MTHDPPAVHCTVHCAGTQRIQGELGARSMFVVSSQLCRLGLDISMVILSSQHRLLFSAMYQKRGETMSVIWSKPRSTITVVSAPWPSYESFGH